MKYLSTITNVRVAMCNKNDQDSLFCTWWHLNELLSLIQFAGFRIWLHYSHSYVRVELDYEDVVEWLEDHMSELRIKNRSERHIPSCEKQLQIKPRKKLCGSNGIWTHFTSILKSAQNLKINWILIRMFLTVWYIILPFILLLWCKFRRQLFW